VRRTCEAQAKAGRIPAEAVEAIRQKANFDVQRIQEIEAQVHHDVIAFLTTDEAGGRINCCQIGTI